MKIFLYIFIALFIGKKPYCLISVHKNNMKPLNYTNNWGKKMFLVVEKKHDTDLYVK